LGLIREITVWIRGIGFFKLGIRKEVFFDSFVKGRGFYKGIKEEITGKEAGLEELTFFNDEI